MRSGRVLLVLLVAAVAVPSASASPRMQLGVFDDVEALQHPGPTFTVLKKLHVQVVRMTLNWSDRWRRRGRRGGRRAARSRGACSPGCRRRAAPSRRSRLRANGKWAPYYGRPGETPSTKPAPGQGDVELGNIDRLVAELTHLYGPRRVWITEYGYQTNPPDRELGVTWAQQAKYLREAYAIAKANSRIDLFTWFPLRDDPNVPVGWQSGLLTVTGEEKPAYSAFAHLG